MNYAFNTTNSDIIMQSKQAMKQKKEVKQWYLHETCSLLDGSVPSSRARLRTALKDLSVRVVQSLRPSKCFLGISIPVDRVSPAKRKHTVKLEQTYIHRHRCSINISVGQTAGR